MASHTPYASTLSTAAASSAATRESAEGSGLSSAPSNVAGSGSLNTLYVVSVDFDAAHAPILSPPPVHGTKPSKNGYQFPSNRQDAALLFVIADGARADYAFAGFELQSVPAIAPTSTAVPAKPISFAMPVVRGTYMSPSMLLVELYFPAKSEGPQEASLNLLFQGPDGRILHDPQVGNDGGNIVPPDAAQRYDTQDV